MEWTLQDLGALGEFVGAIAVVVTLAYLALQIRHNTGAMRAQSTTTIAQLAQNTFLTSAGDGELVEILGREAAGGEVTDLEQSRANSFRMATFAAFENVYLHHHEGFIRDDVAASRDLRTARILSDAPARLWWEGAKQLFATGFQRHVDALLQSDEPGVS